MDLVYAYKKTDTNELRYSIRSAVKHLKFDKIIILGEKPEWLDALEIYVPDTAATKAENVINKLRATDDNRVSEDFIYMNDDFFLLQDYLEIPYYYNYTIKDWVEKYPREKGLHYEHLIKLYKEFPQGKYFEIHFPIVYNKKKLKAVIEKYGLSDTLMTRSYYCNEYKVKAVQTKDYKDTHNLNSPFISTSNIGFLVSQTKIKARFNLKSKYELNSQTTKY